MNSTSRGLGVHVARPVGDLQCELRNFRRRRGQLFVDMRAIGLRIVGLREADDELAVLSAFLDE